MRWVDRGSLKCIRYGLGLGGGARLGDGKSGDEEVKKREVEIRVCQVVANEVGN
jgi:hypothetical protein